MDLANELEKMDEDELDDIGERGDEGPTDTRTNAQKSKPENTESDNDVSVDGIDHGDYFQNDKGGAKVAQGDDKFDEETYSDFSSL